MSGYTVHYRTVRQELRALDVPSLDAVNEVRLALTIVGATIVTITDNTPEV